MEKQPQIKNFITKQFLKNFVDDLNNYFRPVNLEIDNKYRPATESETKNNQNIDMGNYFPYESMTLFIVWNRKTQTLNESGQQIEKTERYRIGQIAMDQIYAKTNLNLPEIYIEGISQFYSKMTNEDIVKKVKSFVSKTLLFHMVQEHGEEYLNEISRYMHVLSKLNMKNRERFKYEGRLHMNARLGQLMEDIERAKDFGSKTMLDLDKSLKLLDYINLENHPL